MKTPASAGRFTPAAAASSETRAWWPPLMALGVFLLARPYEGLVHDARLYVGFAVASLDASGIGTDLLFRYDAQSGRSLFPVLLRALSAALSPSYAALLVTVAGLLLWFNGAWRLLRRMWPDLPPRVTAALLVAATTVHTYYGGSSTFHFAEPFASPRVIAEALVLWALSTALERRLRGTVALLGAALLVHPLMAVSGVAVAAWLAVNSARARLWLLAVALGGGALLAGLAASGLAVGPLRPFDREWMQVLDVMGALVFLRNWEPIDWARVAVHVVTAAMAASVLTGVRRTLVLGVMVTSVGGLLFTGLGADVLHSMLLTQAQPWRALWLLALVAAVSLGWLLYHVGYELPGPWRSTVGYTALAGFRQTAVGLLLIAWFMVATSDAAATMALLAALLWWVPVWRPTMQMPAAVPAVFATLVPLLLALIVWFEARVVWQVYAASPNATLLWYWPTFVLAGGMRLVGGGVVWWLLKARHEPAGWRRLAVVAVTVVCVVGALTVFDSRSAFERLLERELDARVAGVGAPLAEVPPGPVFWSDGEVEPWAFFGRAGYASIIQGTPRVFSRQLALQWTERRRRITRLQSVAREPRYRLRLDRLDSDDPSGARALCTADDAPTSLVLWRRPAWATRASIVTLPEPQLLPGQDPGEPWEVRRTMVLVTCADVRSLQQP